MVNMVGLAVGLLDLISMLEVLYLTRFTLYILTKNILIMKR